MTLCDRCFCAYEGAPSCPDCVMRLTSWLAGPPRIIGQWRRRARKAMLTVVNRWLDDTPHVDPAALLKLVDAAYPFGERAMHPYKAWLAERKLLVEVLTPPKLPPEPTVDDAAACEVAIDLVETGREDEARKLLDEQAPRRLNRACPACGAKVGKACHEAETYVNQTALDRLVDGKIGTGPLSSAYRGTRSIDRIVPHLARVEPQQPVPMPLFERSEP